MASACVGPAWAAPENLRQGLFGHEGFESRQFRAPPVARYVSEDGDGFVVDRTQAGRVLLKFDNSPEVWALQAKPGPRGDTIYKNDLGESVLRATRLGGVTIFTDQRPSGSAAALSGASNPLRLQPLGPQALLERLAQSSARASRAARRLISFNADATPASSALIADAAAVASEAVARMARRPDAAQILSRVRQVRLEEGRRPGVQLSGGRLQITVAPAQGLAGRPSSERIVAAAEQAANR
ncbi:DUF4908 domain-containing protein [Phenylobacterium sp. LjRoot225]|uniref:DUF4908 domain-containing protein n=1 Tax=Phenylobacterium sp. LjRoot225 TaxID=3342285 RepID=UPI003ECE85BE